MGCTAVERNEVERWGDGVALVCAIRYFRREWDAWRGLLTYMK